MSITPLSSAQIAALRNASSSDVSSTGTSTSAWPTTPEYTPLGDDATVTSRFLVEVDGVQLGVFKTFSGLSAQVATETINEGGNNQYPIVLPGRITWGNVTLTRGVTNADVLFEWFSQTSGDGYTTNSNQLSRKTAAVTAISLEGTRLRSWNFVDVFPVRWKGPDFNIDSEDPLIEELELAHHGFTSNTPT
jgi:phage tail-like protein